jgi:SNF2 family DNA or RNA helicase
MLDDTVHELDVREQVHACLRFLAECCDGAYSLAQAGFNRVDAAFGRELAENERLTLAQVIVGARMIRKYHRQLETGGLHAPTSKEVDAYLDLQIAQAGKSEQPGIPVLPRGEKGANRVYLHQDRIVVVFPFDQSKLDALAPLKRVVDGWRFDYLQRKEWSYPKKAANVVIESLKPFADFTYSKEFIDLVAQIRCEEALARELAGLEEALQEREKQAALGVAQPYLQGIPLADGNPLYVHQREAVRFLITKQRAILAHDLGLGKTRSALIAAKSYGLPILVVVPAGLRITWLREAEAADVSIEVFSWAKVPEPPEAEYVLIGDECHYAQSLDAQRTQAFLKLAEQAHIVFPVTGTPIKNGRPINLFPLLMAIRHPLAQDQHSYEKRYCAADFRKVNRDRYVYDVTGASHLDELRAKIKEHVFYKKKEECLDLPPKIRVLRPAEVSAQAETEYHKTLERLRADHERRMQAKREGRLQALLEELGEESELIDLDELEASLSEADDNARALVELGILRHAGSLAKIDSALEIAQEVQEEGGNVVLFSAYRDTAARIAQKLVCNVLDGATPTEERQRMIDNFQERKS